MKLKLLSGLSILAFISTSCFKEKEFPVTPSAEVIALNVDYVNDTAQAVIKFRDGDGDLDSLGIEYFMTENGQWIRPIDPFGFEIMDITPSGKIKSVEGELSVGKLFLDPNDSVQHQVKFVFQLFDRAGNASGKAESPVFNRIP